MTPQIFINIFILFSFHMLNTVFSDLSTSPIVRVRSSPSSPTTWGVQYRAPVAGWGVGRAPRVRHQVDSVSVNLTSLVGSVTRVS